MHTPRVVVVDDEASERQGVRETLERLGEVEVVVEAESVRALDRLRGEPVDLLIVDVRMPVLDGVDLLRAARRIDSELAVLMLTDRPTVETAVACLKLGAVDYLTKPLRPEELLATVRRILDARRLEAQEVLTPIRSSCDHAFDELVGGSPAMEAVFETTRRVAGADVDVLVTGETGTGKELAARAIHRRSRRAKERFVPVDCGAIPDHLLESEFFGFEKGAFTGASARRIGLLQHADGGTFFLDEIGELPPLLQAKLLRALQERKIRPVGAMTETRIDVRVIAATGRDLDDMVAEGTFRQDLLYRINVVKIALPPLRARGDDVLRLAEHFVRRHSIEMRKPISGIRAEALDLIARYGWPGNVRELQNVIRRGIAMTRSTEIGVEDLPESIVAAVQGRSHGEPSPGRGARVTFFDERAHHVAAFEREYLAGMLDRHHGDVGAAACDAGIPRGTFYRLLKKLGLRATEYRPGSE